MRFEPIPQNFLALPRATVLGKRFTTANEVIPLTDFGYMDVTAAGLTDEQISQIVSGYNTLTPQVSKPIVAVNEETVISGYPTFDYVVRKDDIRVMAGNIDDGLLEITFDSAGDYLIEISIGNASGYVGVTVNV